MRKIKLVLYFRDKEGKDQMVSGSYEYDEVLRKLAEAKSKPNFAGFDLLDAV